METVKTMSVLKNLKKFRNEILKAEILSYLALWDKINPDKGPNYFGENINIQNIDLHGKTSTLNINILNKSFNAWNHFLNNWRNWRRKSSTDNLLQILYGISENLNSGIEKGSPKEDNKIKPENQKWISNAFGSYKNEIIYLSRSESEINAIIGAIENSLDKVLSNLDYESYIKFKKNLKNYFTNLLSDDRYPINDVTLWDQAYMATSMFKASLANYVMKNSSIDSTLPDRTSIKWRILGIQYDKLGLAEKGFKPAHISWYREISNKIDEEVKELLEYKYPIGNEVYRDETGIYFIVGEDLGEDLPNENLAKLKDDLSEIKQEILNIFNNKSIDEFYPAVFLTKASRGLMNFTYLLEKAKENFLKADWSNKKTNKNLESNRAIGICQVCKQKLVFESDKRDENKNICKTCYEQKTKGRIDEWLNNRADETIWIDELKDKNDRIALVVMKFELMDWLNGDLLSSEVINIEDKEESKEKIKNFLIIFCSGIDISESFNTSSIDAKIDEIESRLTSEKDNNKKQNLGQEKGKLQDLSNKVKELGDLIKNIRAQKWWKRSFQTALNFTGFNNTIENLFKLILEKYSNIKDEFNIPIFDKISFFPLELSPDAYRGCKSNNESFDDYIKQIFFGSIIGTEWENFIKNHTINSKIDWQKETINWQSLDNSDIDFFSPLLLQFLLRKNPSPTRLRRIWESTKEFFEKVKKKFLCVARIPDKRRVRLYWENINILEGEYYDGEAVFWVKEKVYLISYLKDNYQENFKLKKREDNSDTGIDLEKQKAKIEFYKPYISIIDPTPISYQFIIPAEYVPYLIENVTKLYDEHFKYVYGKLPLHIGVIIQDYKHPLYVGINALRKIRRDISDREKLWVNINANDFKTVFNEKLKIEKIEKQCNNPLEYYSLYFGELVNGDYQFYVAPKDNPFWLESINKISDNEKIKYIPNTFDFEFLDTNTRRNDIYYNNCKNYRRILELKNNRPYNVEKYFSLFLKFKEVFSISTSKSKLNNLISLLYDKLENFDSNTRVFLASAIINILEPHKNQEINEFVKKWLEVNNLSHREITDKITTEKIKIFLDMYEFWHKALKEV